MNAGRLVLALAVLGTAAALFGVNHRAAQGRNALVKWGWAFEALDAGGALYGRGVDSPSPAGRAGDPTAEGYPTLPVTLLLLRPFHALGDRAGPVAWAAMSAGFAWFVVLVALGLAARPGTRLPPAAALVVVVVAGRVLHSQLQHGNIDLAVAATVAAAALAWTARRPGLAGLALGAGAVLKVTPALGLLWLLRARSGRGLAGFVLALLVGVVLLPGAALGLPRTLALTGEWWGQMIAPYFGPRSLTLVQTEHINQSLLGVLARHLTDAVAIEARPPTHATDVALGWAHLGPGALRGLHAALAAAVAVVFYRSCPGPPEGPVDGPDRRDPRAALAAAALLGLAMLALSERSWKHHFVLLPLPLAYLAGAAWQGASTAARVAVVALALAGAAILGTGDALLGDRRADLAEAHGAYFAAGAVLFVAVARVLRAERRVTSAPARGTRAGEGPRSASGRRG